MQIALRNFALLIYNRSLLGTGRYLHPVIPLATYEPHTVCAQKDWRSSVHSRFVASCNEHALKAP